MCNLHNFGTMTMTSSASDNDDIDMTLARMTSQGLSMGPSIITQITEDSLVLLPSKLLHPGLYDCSLRDIPMDTAAAASATIATRMEEKRAGGVPGFPDFPDFWMGETSRGVHQQQYHNQRRWGWATKHGKPSPRTLRRRRSSLRVPPRRAVNVYGISPSITNIVTTSKEIKKLQRDERKIRRIEQSAKLRERRRRKSDMGEICRGIGSIMCD